MRRSLTSCDGFGAEYGRGVDGTAEAHMEKRFAYDGNSGRRATRFTIIYCWLAACRAGASG